MTALDDKQKEAAEKAILDIKVCDPACGSGAFLIGADNYLGQQLAKVRAGDEYPAEAEVRRARRDVLSHCIYGVDLNPMAVELCKVSLWINACVENFPLSFLDHHMKWGNSLIGLTQALHDETIPSGAYAPVGDDDQAWAAEMRRRNGTASTSLQRDIANIFAQGNSLRKGYRHVAGLPDDSADQVHAKMDAWAKYLSSAEYQRDKLAADIWCAPFFWNYEQDEDAPTITHVWDIRNAVHAIPSGIKAEVRSLAEKHRFFHWHLEFPEEFASGGFDVVLGNPPWDRIKLEEEEHWIDDPYISRAPNKAQRARRIEEYRHSDDPRKLERVARFDAAGHDAEALSKFLRQSGRFPLSARGDINTYAVFTELARSLLSPLGRAGMIVPTGIATDNTTKDFFGDLLETHSLARLTGFENEAFIFPDVHHSFKFCALSMTGQDLNVQEADFVFLCRYFEQVEDERRHFRLSSEDFALLNPNTKTCPIFRTGADAELTKAIYRRVPVLIDERRAANPWGVRFLRMIDMANDSGLFKDEPADDRLPLYEAKMIHQFDHRFATYEGATQANLNAGILPQTSQEQKQDPNFAVLPRYWVSEEEVILRTSKVPPRLISAYRAKDEKMLGEELVYWMAGYHYNHENVEMGTHIFSRMLSFTSTTSALINTLLCQELERDYPLTEQDMRSMQRFAGDKSSLFPLAWMLIRSKAPKWLIGFRDVTSSIVERTAIFSLLPEVGVGHKIPLAFLESSPSAGHAGCCLANMNSMVFDYVTRQKIGGSSLSYFILKQLPVLSPEAYSTDDLTFLVPRVMELVYTAWDIKPFADDVWKDGSAGLRAAIQTQWGQNSSDTGGIQQLAADGGEQTEGGIDLPPFKWDDERRAAIRAELDAYYAKLYGLTEQELRYILDPKDVCGKDFPSETFRVLQQRDEQRYGEFKTRTRILDAWRKLHS